MKTRHINSIRLVKNSTLILVLLIGFFQQGISQRAQTQSKKTVDRNTHEITKPKNTISFTPLKGLTSQRMNFAYEREMYKNVFVTGDLQVWFQDRAPRPFLLIRSNDKSTNKGTRASVGIRNYFVSKSAKTSFYLGASMFFGSHEISKTEGSREAGLLLSGKNGYYGEVALFSRGIIFGLGVRKNFANSMFIEFGLNTGRAWTNKGKDSITLISYDQPGAKRNEKLDSIINGKFVEPMFNFGIAF